MEIDLHELKRLQECERAWQTLCHALIAGNPATFQQQGTGTGCALREIQRLQALAAKVEQA